MGGHRLDVVLDGSRFDNFLLGGGGIQKFRIFLCSLFLWSELWLLLLFGRFLLLLKLMLLHYTPCLDIRKLLILLLCGGGHLIERRCGAESGRAFLHGAHRTLAWATCPSCRHSLRGSTLCRGVSSQVLGQVFALALVLEEVIALISH